IGPKDVVPVLIEGLRRLEYRGYDSAGVAVVHDGAVDLRRSAGKLSRLEDVIRLNPITGDYGVGHTRWATHGRPTEENAHPHRDCTGKIVVVHNGIIENYLDLKQELQRQGHTFVTETDTEIIAHLVERETKDDGLENAVRRALMLMRGLFALVLISADDPGKIVAVRNGPPIVVGLGDGEFFVASDTPAILSHTRDVVFLGDEEMAIVTRTGVSFTDFFGRPVSTSTQRVLWDPIMAEKAGYKHFMLKEIFEQPTAARETILGRVSQDTGKVFLEEMTITDAQLAAVERVTILACGTSWHASLVGKFLIEQFARVPVDVDYASEYRYRSPIVSEKTLAIVITQSGETADTIAALREATLQGARTLAICNVVGSQVTRAAEGALITQAGPEIGVASTKAFTTQLAMLALLAVHIGRARGTMAEDTEAELVRGLRALPAQIERVHALESQIESLALKFHAARNALYLARGVLYPIALEGALKLKEISYIHAEGYPAGELKHGPIALIDKDIPLIALMPNDRNRERTLSNLQEAAARDGKIIALVSEGDHSLDDVAEAVIELPLTHPCLAPILYAVPLQLFAYHIAVLRGCDVDRPRNLAKSVTVE
ncbi:MAG TPA: glutamine--fructose-6-phosphate transaminase (isomerizing), partial [Polyangiaceae bacterium]|nr:glutamine--fructose-6-phosphate transaminase (isomerizing) [Polyangiaceae bacterium]